MGMMELKIADYGFMPIKQTTGSAGFDIYSPVSGNLSPEECKQTCEIDTGIFFIPNASENITKRFFGRSGYAVKFGLSVRGDILESGELRLYLKLLGDKPITWNRQERIAQLVLLS